MSAPTTAFVEDVIAAGASYALVLTDTDSDGEATDLTGVTATLQIRRTVSSSTNVLSLTSSPAAGITIDATAGTVTYRLTDEQTSNLSGRYIAHGYLTWPDGTVERNLELDLVVSPKFP